MTHLTAHPARLLLATALLALGSTSQAEEASAKPSPPGSWKLVSGTASQKYGAWTVPERAVFRAWNGSTVEVFSGQVRLLPKPQRLMVDGAVRQLATFQIDSGRVLVGTTEPGAFALLYTARKSVAVSYKGRAEAIVDPARTSFANRGGDLLTSSGQRYTELKEGQIRTFTKNRPDGELSQLIPAPRVKAEHVVFSAARAPARLGGLSWQADASTDSYEVSVINRASQAAFRVRTKDSKIDDLGIELVPGVYDTRVAAVDPIGHQGTSSKPLELRVLGVELPPGAFVDQQGVIRIGLEQSMRFTEVTGMRMTFGARRPYTSAGQPISLIDDEPMYVHLTLPGSGDVVTTKMAPRGISARVKLTPKNAIWPRDRVMVSVRLKTDNGAAVPSFIEPKLSARIGVEPVNLHWTEKGGTYSAWVPQPEGAGPWVVRVDVHDQYGIELGRNVLEVAPGR